MRDMLRRLTRARETDESGQGTVEYTMVVGTISLVVVAAFVTSGIETSLTALAADLTSAISP